MDTRWFLRAACKGMPLYLFFPLQKNHGYVRARAVCNRCPVILECRADAFKHDDPKRNMTFGMQGGMTPMERADAR